ncbi:cyclic AMP receptor-like protein G isoform X2 [Linepithema humile]
MDNILPIVNEEINSDSNNNEQYSDKEFEQYSDKKNQIDQTNEMDVDDNIAVINRNDNNNTMDLEVHQLEGQENIAGNASPILITNNLLTRNVIFQDLPSDIYQYLLSFHYLNNCTHKNNNNNNNNNNNKLKL